MENFFKNDNETKELLKQFIHRIERLEGEKKDIAEDIKEVYQEAKGRGFDVKIMREVIKRRKIERQRLKEIDSLVEVYEDTIQEGRQNNE